MSKKTHTFKGFDKPIAIFRTGDHVDSSGQKVTITAEDLQQMVSNYEADSHPYVIGHPEDDAPAYGWSAGFSIKDDTLFTDHENVQPAFEEAVESGAFRNRSVSIAKNENNEWYIKHIGFLGGAAPAIKGLENLSFSQDNAPLHTFEFSNSDLTRAHRAQGWAMRALSNLFRGVREDIIETRGVEAADKAVPSYELDSISDAANKMLELQDGGSAHLYSHPNLQHSIEANMSKKEDNPTPKGDEAKFTEAQVAEREKAAADAAEKAAEAKFEHKKKCKEFALKLEDEGKILPQAVNGLARFMESLSPDIEITFSEGEGAEAKDVNVSQFEQAQSLFNELPNSFAHLKKEQCRNEGGEDDSVGSDAAALVKRANKFQASQLAAGLTVSFSEALNHITAESGNE